MKVDVLTEGEREEEAGRLGELVARLRVNFASKPRTRLVPKRLAHCRKRVLSPKLILPSISTMVMKKEGKFFVYISLPAAYVCSILIPTHIADDHTSPFSTLVLEVRLQDASVLLNSVTHEHVSPIKTCAQG